MERVRVDSSSIASIGYDAGDETLEIEFHSGGVYQYFDVPAHAHAALRDADSIGRHFVAHVRDRYEFARVDAEGRAPAGRR
jgi:hypothetical protein